MENKLYKYLFLFFSLLLIVHPDAAFSANFQWIQDDWRDGPSTEDSTQHDSAQNGRRDWKKFFSRDSTIELVTQGLTLSKVSDTKTDTDFSSALRTNVEVDPVNGLRIKPFIIDRGSGADGALVIDGKTAGNNTLNGVPLGQTYPRILDTPENITSSAVSGGSLSPASYYYVVAAYNVAGESLPAAKAQSSTNVNRSIVLSWNSVKCADGYRIYGRLASGTLGLLATVTGENTTTYTDTGVTTPNTSIVPGVTNTSDGAFIVTGGENYSDVTVQNCGGISSALGAPLTVPAGVTSGFVSGSGPVGSFTYIVTAADSRGLETNRSSVVNVTANGSSSVRISWSPVTGASGYRVYRRLQSGSFTTASLVCNTAEAFCTDIGAPLSAGAPPVNLSAAIPVPTAAASNTGGSMSGGTYYYVLTAVDYRGFETTPGSQRSISVSAGTNTNSVSLSWTAVSDAYGYRVYRSTTAGRFNSPALVCTISDPSVRTCTDTLSQPLEGGPPSNYYNALASGGMNLRALNEIRTLSRSAIYMSHKGYPGGNSVIQTTSQGLRGDGPGAGITQGAGAGYGTIGINNSSNEGYPGNPYGDKPMTINHAGSGGASGRVADSQGISGKGGRGGGVLRLFADRIYLENGEILTEGEDGGNGSGRWGNGGGGGSGGSLIIGGNNVDLISGTLSALGGDGGRSTLTYFYYVQGGSGGSGRIRIAPLNNMVNNSTINPAPLIGNEGTYESVSFTLDNNGVTFETLSWDAAVPSGNPSSTLKFQIATNSDNQSWNFKGPDGTSSSFYSISSAGCSTAGTETICSIPASHTGHRYFRYRAYLTAQTVNPDDSPAVSRVSVNFRRTRPVQSLVSSPYDTTDLQNAIYRLQWSETLPAGSDAVVQLRTSPAPGTNFVQWGPWYGPNRTTFSASSGVTTINVADASIFSTGRVVTLYDSTITSSNRSSRCTTPPDEHDGLEVRKISSISGNAITLNSVINCSYLSGSILTDTFTNPAGSVPIIQDHRTGSNDQWLQYKVYLLSDNSESIPTFSSITVGYQRADIAYKPDGIIMSNGGDVYGGAGSGDGGNAAMTTNPASHGGMAAFLIELQNDGGPLPDPLGRATDSFEISWVAPASDAVGGQVQQWSVFLCGFTDYSSDSVCDTPLSSGFITGSIPVNLSESYYLLVTPSFNAPAGSSRNIIVDIRSVNDYSKVDSVRAVVNISTIYQGDGVIQGIGAGIYDPCAANPSVSCSGAGGVSPGTANAPGNEVVFNVVLYNRGNISDTYKFSLSKSPPPGWTVIINGGSGDVNITDPQVSWVTPSIGSTANIPVTLKIIPRGAPVTQNVILNIYSNGAGRYSDSLNARVTLASARKVDGIIYGFGYDASGEIKDFTLLGSECGTTGPGDDIYGATGSGNGGCAALDVAAGSSRVISVGVQNEGNLPDRFEITWNTPADLTVSLVGNPPPGGLCSSGFPCYNPGEVPFFSFNVAASGTFSGSRTIIFNIKSLEDTTKVDSVKAIINSRDVMKPSPVVLSMSNQTSTSIKVSWIAPGDDGSAGTAASYDLRYSTSLITDAVFSQARRVEGCLSGETNLRQPKVSGSQETCTITRLFASTDYYFALKTTDDAGNVSDISTCSPSDCRFTTSASSDSIRPGAIDNLSADSSKIINPLHNPSITSSAHTITLRWTAKADDGDILSSGPATAYELRYSTRKIVDDDVVNPRPGEIAFSEAIPVTVLLRYDSQLVVPVCLDGVTDNVQVEEAFRSNQGELLPPKLSGGAECYTVIVENKITAFKDASVSIEDDRTHNTKFYFALKALDERGNVSAANKSAISNPVDSITSLVPNAYNMVSVPYIPPVSTNRPADVFGDDVGTPLYSYHWDSRGLNSNSGCYNGVPSPHNREILNDGAGNEDGICDSGEACHVCSQINSIEEGSGYFLWAPYGSSTLDVPASSLPSSSSASYSPACDDGAGGTFPCYILPLQNGWNMVANTFDKEINFSNRDVNGDGDIDSNEKGLYVSRTTGNGPVTARFQDAVTGENVSGGPMIDGSVYIYNGINYTYGTCGIDTVLPAGSGCPIVMQPWKSYWIRVFGNGTFNLLIPD